MPRPEFDPVDAEQHKKRGEKQHDANRGRLGIFEFIKLRYDLQRHDLRLSWDVAGDENDRPVFADGARESEGDAAQPRGKDLGEYHAAKGRPTVRAETMRGLLKFGIPFLKNRLHTAHDEGQADKDQDDDDTDVGIAVREIEPGERIGGKKVGVAGKTCEPIDGGDDMVAEAADPAVL